MLDGEAQVLRFLAELHSPEEVLAMRAPTALSARVRELLEKSKGEGLSEAEREEWQRYEELEHRVRIAKAGAASKLGAR
jgi:hypothetical protein